jgi:hypothetical protein
LHPNEVSGFAGKHLRQEILVWLYATVPLDVFSLKSRLDVVECLFDYRLTVLMGVGISEDVFEPVLSGTRRDLGRRECLRHWLRNLAFCRCRRAEVGGKRVDELQESGARVAVRDEWGDPDRGAQRANCGGCTSLRRSVGNETDGKLK